MSVLIFEDDELDELFNVVNNMQICFHPKYAPEGKFTVYDFVNMKNMVQEINIIVDNNIVSPVCEIAKNGTLNNQERLRKIAAFITWTKYIGANLTCGIGLLENDTADISNISGEERRLQFLHGVDVIPALIWKALAFGAIESVPEQFLFKGTYCKDKNFRIDNDFLLLSNETAIVKLVQLIREKELTPIDKFISYMEWYADHMNIAESMVVYAAMVLKQIPNVSLPKSCGSGNYEKVVRGIKNQAWDLTYITIWSTEYYNEKTGICWMFATDDITQKIITVNVIPPGRCGYTLDAIFTTKSEQEKLRDLHIRKFGNARVCPFGDVSLEEKVLKIKQLLDDEYKKLKYNG